MKAARSLLISCLLVIGVSHSVSAYNHPRQNPSSPSSTNTEASTTSVSPTPSTTSMSSTPTSSSPTTTEQPTTSNTPPTSTSPSVAPSTSPSTPTSTPPASNNPSTPTSASPTPSVFTSQFVSIDAEGSTTVVTITNPLSSTNSGASTPTATKGADDDGAQSGLGTGSIVGISVAGGVAVIAILAFVGWKFTRKRFTDFDDNEAIKWPELNAHGENTTSHPLPVKNTGRFDTGSEASLSRVASTSNYSTPDVASGSDPYAIPPLPHLNPNQPYRDDPTATTGYYDPYRGPIPGSIEHGNDDWVGENIPMTQLAGRSSPRPQAAFSTGDYGAGRQSPSPLGPYEGGRTGSPGPQTAYGGRASPGPQATYGGRASPGPQAAYGGRASPGPQAAYGGGASPGPQAAYNAGRASPGPQAAYDPYGKR